MLSRGVGTTNMNKVQVALELEYLCSQRKIISLVKAVLSTATETPYLPHDIRKPRFLIPEAIGTIGNWKRTGQFRPSQSFAIKQFERSDLPLLLLFFLVTFLGQWSMVSGQILLPLLVYFPRSSIMY